MNDCSKRVSKLMEDATELLRIDVKIKQNILEIQLILFFMQVLIILKVFEVI